LLRHGNSKGGVKRLAWASVRECHPNFKRAIVAGVVRALVGASVSVALALVIGVGAAAGLAAFRGGQFGNEFGNSLWIVGCLMLLLTLFSYSPSTRHAQGELSNIFVGRRFAGSDDRGGAGLTVVLGLSAFGMFGIALLVT